MKPSKILTIYFKSNFRVGSGFGLAGLLDHATIKNADGVAIIPGSTLKGRLRMACYQAAMALMNTGNAPRKAKSGHSEDEQNALQSVFSLKKSPCQTPDDSAVCKSGNFEELCIVCRLFGSVYQPGALIFSDALPTKAEREHITTLEALDPLLNPAQLQIRNNVKISRWNRISETNMLKTSETVSQELVFQGWIYLDVDSKQKGTQIQSDLQLLEYGSALITHIGAEKARGLGRCTITVEDAP